MPASALNPVNSVGVYRLWKLSGMSLRNRRLRLRASVQGLALEREGGLVIVAVVVCGLDLECHREPKIEIVWLAWEVKASENPVTRNVDGRREF